MVRKNFRKLNEMVKAIQEKDYSIAEKLLDDGLDVDSELMPHKCPILICVEYNAIKIGQLLVKRGCSLSLKNLQGFTPLHLAVQLFNFEFVKLLLDNRADLTTQDNEGKTALHLAAQMNSLRMVELLMKKASPTVLNIVDKEGKIPFIHACAHGSTALLSYFLTKGCNVNKEYGPYQDTPLLTAISNYNCSSDIIIKLLDAGANINYENKSTITPLLKSFLILENINYSGTAYKSAQDICTLLIERGGKVNVRNGLGDTPLHIAVLLNDELLVRKLLNAGSLVNVRNNLHLTPLFYACQKGLQEIASLLLDCGANIKFINYMVCDYQWLLSEETYLFPNTCSVLKYVIQKSKECRDLRSSCRLAIRKSLPMSIDQSVSLLPLPPSLVKFILLVD